MDLSKSLKKILISSAALLMTGSIIGTGNVANAKHRRYHYRYARRARRNVYKYGYYKHGRYHYYKTGYFRNGKWIKRHTKSHRHAKYMWIDNPNTNKYVRVQVVGKKYMNNEKDEPYYIFKSNNKNLIYANGWPVRKGYGAAWGPGNLSPYIFAHNPAASSDNNNDNTPVHHSHVNSTARNLSKFRAETLSLVNQDRANSTGMPPLHESPDLDQIAQIRAKQAYHDEDSSDPHIDQATGNGYADEVGYKLGYNNSPSDKVYGGNLAWGSTTAKGFNNQWYTDEKSSNGGHYQNIVGDNHASKYYTKIGIGVYKDTAAEEFSGPRFNNNLD